MDVNFSSGTLLPTLRTVIATAAIAAGATASGFFAPTLAKMRRGRIVFDVKYAGGTAAFKVGITGQAVLLDAYNTGATKATIPAAVKARAYVVPPGVLVGDYSLKVIGAAAQPTGAANKSVVTIIGTE